MGCLNSVKRLATDSYEAINAKKSGLATTGNEIGE